MAALRAKAPPAYPAMPRIMEAFVRSATSSGDPTIPARLHVHTTGSAKWPARVDERTRATEVVRSFERIFSETCPASIVKLVVVPESSAVGRAPGLDVKVEVTWPPAPTWKLATAPDRAGDLAIAAPTYVFEVALRGIAPDDVATFRLAMPPPDKPSMELRARSLFVLAGAPPPEGTFDERIHDVLSARAFDRLYDELWSLFFTGDPRVPLRAPPPSTLD
jgi:hypothetical protein